MDESVDKAMLEETLPPAVSEDMLSKMRAKVNTISGLTETEKKFLDDNSLRRYIRARKMDVNKAFAMISETMEWRRKFDVEKLLTGDLKTVMKEGETGKMYVFGNDKAGRAVLYMKPRNQNSKDNKGQIQHLVYSLERACATSVAPQEKIVLLLDFKGYSMRNAPGLKTMKETLTILQNHYPERLGLAICVEAPALFASMYKLVKPFIDPVTAKKIMFLGKTQGFAPGTKAKSVIDSVFNLDMFESEFGGNNKEPYSNEKYFAERFLPDYLQ